MYADNAFIQTVSLKSHANRYFTEYGIDNPNECTCRAHYDNSPAVEYQYNEIGFREISVKKFLGPEILAIGDSFTVSLGLNIEDSWVKQLEKELNYPVLNFGMNGASNNWIARKCLQLLEYFDPPCVVLHWSFSHRRESDKTHLPDEARMIHIDAKLDPIADYNNWLACVEAVENNRKNIPIVHSFIYDWHHAKIDYTTVKTRIPIIPPLSLNLPPSLDKDFQLRIALIMALTKTYSDKEEVYAQFNAQFGVTRAEVNYLVDKLQEYDLARDGFHYGPVTSKKIATIMKYTIKTYGLL